MLKIGILNAPISRKGNSIIERCVSSEGQTAITHYEVLKQFENYSLLQCQLETGRTHQIRVHMAHIGHPLLGDSLYNKNTNAFSLISRQALHSYKMEFIHPVTNRKIIIEAEIPQDINNLII